MPCYGKSGNQKNTGLSNDRLAGLEVFVNIQIMNEIDGLSKDFGPDHRKFSINGDDDATKLADVMDVRAIQSLMDDFYKITHIGAGILDVSGEILVKTGWQDICTKYHRVHPETRKHCMESDTILTENIRQGEFKLYKCKNNMWDIATPIIVGEKHLGNLYLGQFLFEDEDPDLDLFREQARKYGFDEKGYLEALSRVPRWSRDQIEAVMHFYTDITVIISSLGHKNIQLTKALNEWAVILDELHESEQKFSKIFQVAPILMAISRIENGAFVDVNGEFLNTTGYSRDEVIGRTSVELQLFTESTRKRLIDFLNAEGQISGLEIEIKTKGQQLLNCIFQAQTIEWHGGKFLLTAALDITGRKKAEEERKREMSRIELLNSHMVNRELKMVALKKEILDLKKKPT